jgi:hemerythrin-like domain-containing protein
MSSATELLRLEHRAIEAALARFERELGNPQGEGLVALSGTFREIHDRLALHFRQEEDVFYPALAPRLGPTDMTIAKLRNDHADVRETSSYVQDLLDRALGGSPANPSLAAELTSMGWTLWNLIHHHIAEEEKGLLASADRTLDATTQADLAEQMRQAGGRRRPSAESN